MAAKTQYGRIALLSQEKASWLSTTVLLKGEIGIESDTGLFKIGDGSTAWSDLAYANKVVDLLTATTDSTSALSAKQGAVLKGLVDEKTSYADIEADFSKKDHTHTSSNITDFAVAVKAIKVDDAAEADKLTTARKISLSGDVSGEVSFDGSADVTITATVADDSHNHVIDNIDGLQDALDAKAPLESPTFTGTPSVPTAAVGTDTTQAASTAFVKAEIDSVIAATHAMHFAGVVSQKSDLPDSPTIGDVYVVAVEGDYVDGEKTCEPGDMIICTNDNPVTYKVVQTNIDGAVTGPTAAVAEHVATFDGATGKIIKDSGFTIEASVPADAKFTDTTYEVATETADGLMSKADYKRLKDVEAGAQVNQNAIAKIKVGDSTVEADAEQTEVEYEGAGGLSIEVSGKKVTFTAPSAATVDSEMSDTSGNAVQNKVIKKYVDDADSALQAKIEAEETARTDKDAELDTAVKANATAIENLDAKTMDLIKGKTDEIIIGGSDGQAVGSGVKFADLINVKQDIVLFQCTLETTVPTV